MSIATEKILDPAKREFPEFSLTGLLTSVFTPTNGCRVCILTDFHNPETEMKDYAFLKIEEYAVQQNAHKHFYLGLKNGAMKELGMTGGEMFAYKMTYGSNLDHSDPCWDAAGQELSLENDIYPNYDLILCISTWSATAPLTEKCKIHGFPRCDDARAKRHHPLHRPRSRL